MKCSHPYCKSHIISVHINGKPLCEKHWLEHCENDKTGKKTGLLRYIEEVR